MKILLVANRVDDALDVERSLVDEGHSVATCRDAQGGPCRDVADPDSCPLESSVDLTVVARSPEQQRGLDEMGAVCSARHRVGVVEIDPRAPCGVSLYELADAAEARICHQYEREVLDALHEIQPDLSVNVDVRRHDRDIRVRIQLHAAAADAATAAAGSLATATIADRARVGVRRHDRFAQVIDVAVINPN